MSAEYKKKKKKMHKQISLCCSNATSSKMVLSLESWKALCVQAIVQWYHAHISSIIRLIYCADYNLKPIFMHFYEQDFNWIL